MADQINTRFGAIDSRVAGVVRHALDVAVTFTALAPMNEVHLHLADTTRTHKVDYSSLDSPPSHKWHELMVELFGRNPVGTRRAPVSLVDGKPNPTVLAHVEFIQNRRLNSSERRIVHEIFAAAGAFLVAESIDLGEWARRVPFADQEAVTRDSLLAAAQRAGTVGLVLLESAASQTWWRLLLGQGAPARGLPPKRTPTGPPADRVVTPSRRPIRPARRPGARRRRRMVTAAVVAGLVIVLGLGYGSALLVRVFDERDVLAGSGIELPHLKISIMSTTDLAAFWLAVKDGYFRDEGFTFDPMADVTYAKSGAESVTMLASGQVELAYATYPPFIAAQDRGIELRLVAAASSAGPRSCMVVAMPHSKVKSVKDMAGKRVAVTALNTVSQLMVESALRTNGVDYTSIRWVEVPFADMEGKLALGEVDAAFLTEPFLSEAQNNIGAVPVFDTAVGPTLGLPTAGFGASAAFVQKYPKTVAAFRRALERATVEANRDRSTVGPVLVQFTQHADARTAGLPSLLEFESTLDPARIQRVADLMLDFGMTHRAVDVSQMIARVPARRLPGS